jgi:hypothetical protein
MLIAHRVGQLFLVLAIFFGIVGIYIWLDGKAMVAAGRVWFDLHLPSLNYFEVIVSRHLHLTDFWQYQIMPYLQRPAWEASLWLVIVFLILGGLFSVIGRRYRRRRRFS